MRTIRYVPTLVAAALIPAAIPVLLSASVISNVLLVAQAPAKAQSAEAVGRIATVITVRLEGATQGSGVLVKREGDRYTVLTAWHVVSSQGPREELDIYTSDGKRHQLEQESIKRIGDVDLAVLSFRSSGSYEVASIGDVKSVNSGSGIYVSGFPLPTSAVPIRLFRFLKGEVVANASVSIPNGYQLLYSNPTLPGMSGGAALNAQGHLVGIHASAERADQISDRTGKAIATGTNQAVPITYYSQYSSGMPIVPSSIKAETADDYLAQARALLGKRGSEQKIIRLTSQVLNTVQNADAYFYRAYAKDDLGDKQGAIADLSRAIAINPRHTYSYYVRGIVKNDLGDTQAAIEDYSRLIQVDPQYAEAYYNRAHSRLVLGDTQAAIDDYSMVIAIDPQNTNAYYNRGRTKGDSGDLEGAIDDYSKVISIDPQYSSAYNNRGLARFNLGDKLGAIADLNKAIIISPGNSNSWVIRGVAKYNIGDRNGACEDIRKSVYLGSSVGKQFLGKVCP